MTCKYNFKGIEFQSEEELNDFLLDTESTKSSLGDIVYSMTSQQRHYGQRFKEIQDQYQELKDKGIQIKSIQDTEEVEPEDLDDIGTLRYPYISVTDLIHTLPGRYTDQVFPICRSDEYWAKKFNQYRGGVFDNYEIQFIKDLLKETTPGNYEAVHDEETLNKIRDRIEGELDKGIRKGGLWKQQAICGNLVHEMFSRFYRDTIPYTGSAGKIHKGKYLYQLKDSPQEIENYFDKNLDKKYKKYISKPLIKSIIKQCIQFDDELRAKYGKDAYIRTEQPIVMAKKDRQKASARWSDRDLLLRSATVAGITVKGMTNAQAIAQFQQKYHLLKSCIVLFPIRPPLYNYNI